ncbi:hypothetical protein DFR76_108366 [Nocardia pseudobrasiliensis]|uniref:Outer membrane channel protein CpnT-like N-terminal domain-containing protein n=1 Tax=Nocardia pseudobrasiliensis TaxID=45979 RepID=A0A370I1B9_9NOCA|nr:hypothetical protein DFR76_108366 [Nocardia pseudobrasiliensis]
MDLPAELRWLGWVAGSAWPEGDEDRMWAVAADWRKAAAELRDLLPDLAAARRQTIAAYPWGEGREAMVASLDKLGSGPQSIHHLAEILDQVAESADGVGTEIQYTKWLIISTLGLLAVEIAAAWVFPPTAPAVEAAATVATRMAIRLLGERAVSFIARYAARFGEHALVKFLAQHVVIGTAISVGQDFVLQEVQVLQGHRKGIDWNRIGATAYTAAVGGAIGGPVGEQFSKFGTRVTLPGGRWGEAFKGAVIGTGAGMIGAVGSWGIGAWVNGGAWDPRVLTSSASFGALVGGGKGFRHAGAGSARPGTSRYEAPEAGPMGGPEGPRARVAPDEGGRATNGDGSHPAQRPDGSGDTGSSDNRAPGARPSGDEGHSGSRDATRQRAASPGDESSGGTSHPVRAEGPPRDHLSPRPEDTAEVRPSNSRAHRALPSSDEVLSRSEGSGAVSQGRSGEGPGLSRADGELSSGGEVFSRPEGEGEVRQGRSGDRPGLSRAEEVVPSGGEVLSRSEGSGAVSQGRSGEGPGLSRADGELSSGGEVLSRPEGEGEVAQGRSGERASLSEGEGVLSSRGELSSEGSRDLPRGRSEERSGLSEGVGGSLSGGEVLSRPEGSGDVAQGRSGQGVGRDAVVPEGRSGAGVAGRGVGDGSHSVPQRVGVERHSGESARGGEVKASPVERDGHSARGGVVAGGQARSGATGSGEAGSGGARSLAAEHGRAGGGAEESGAAVRAGRKDSAVGRVDEGRSGLERASGVREEAESSVYEHDSRGMGDSAREVDGTRRAVGERRRFDMADEAREQVGGLAREREALRRELPRLRAGIEDAAGRERLAADAAELVGRGRDAEIERLRAQTMRVDPTPEEVAAGRGSEMQRKQAAIDELDRVAGEFHDQRERVFAVTEEITKVAGEDYLRSEGARVVSDRVGLAEGDPPKVIVVGLRSDRAGDSPHEAALTAALGRSPELAEALARPGATVEYVRIAVDSAGRAHAQSMESPSARDFVPERVPQTQPRPASDEPAPPRIPEEEREIEIPDMSSKVPYTPRYFTPSPISDYTAPQPPDNSVWGDPHPEHVFVRPLTGFGEYSEFNCSSGEFAPATTDVGAHIGGVYAPLGDVSVVFYRERGALMLRIDDVVIGLDGVETDWDMGNDGVARFRILMNGATIWERRYDAVPADGDIGRFVYEVMGNDLRRARLFAKPR